MWMDRLKNYVLKYFESHFILVVLVSILLLNYFIYAKVAFLNFYNLPVIAAGYFLGRRAAVLGAFFIILIVWVYILVDPNSYVVNGERLFDLYFHLTVWGAFLILSGALIGTLSQTIKIELKNSQELAEALSQEQNLLKLANVKLEEHMDQLEDKINARILDYETSHSVIESLKTKVEKALYSVMDSTVAKLMIDDNLRNEKRRISVLFSDLKDFTSYSDENPPEKVVGELNRYLHSMEECIIKYYGHIDKYIGDGIMVEFGAPVSCQTHSLMAVLAAMSMQSRVKNTPLGWKMRIGISTGISIIGLFGSQRKSYSCIGDTPNLASRLEVICAPASIYIDEETFKDVKYSIQAERVVNLYGQRNSDNELEHEIIVLEEDLATNPEHLEKLFILGEAYFKKRAATQAIECFRKILEFDPDHTQAKLAYAEADIKKDEFEKIAIKGKRRRMNVYEVVGLLDPMLNRDKISQNFFEKYEWVAEKIKIPEEVVLPVECLDGTIRHGRMVAILSYAIADKMGLSAQEKENLIVAGFLHDLGKQIIPKNLLDSSRQLTELEMMQVKKHPQESVNCIKKLGYKSESILDAVASHHERFDGTGYPNGLKGEEIPIGSRILAVADSFDAMTSTRLFAETWEFKSAIWEIQKDSANGMYDPEIVGALKTLFGI